MLASAAFFGAEMCGVGGPISDASKGERMQCSSCSYSYFLHRFSTSALPTAPSRLQQDMVEFWGSDEPFIISANSYTGSNCLATD